jgi:hypothetical protein
MVSFVWSSRTEKLITLTKFTMQVGEYQLETGGKFCGKNILYPYPEDGHTDKSSLIFSIKIHPKIYAFYYVYYSSIKNWSMNT